MKVAFATCAEKPAGTVDDRLLSDYLRGRGHDVSYEVWSAGDADWKRYDLVFIRSTWDYHFHLPKFLAWAERVSQVTRVLNTRSVIEWNSTKEYLVELAGKGVSSVPTILGSELKALMERAEAALEEYEAIIVKPAVSAGAKRTFKVTTPDEALEAIESALVKGVVLVQPFIESIEEDGEVSLIYVRDGDWRFTHGVQKRPKHGDYRVQAEFGGSLDPFKGEPALHTFAKGALAHAPEGTSFARVDIVDWKRTPMIGELELIEPELFFRFSPEAVERFASLIERS